MHIEESGRYTASLEEMLSKIDYTALQGKACLVTGAAGMLGSCIVDTLRRAGCQVIAVVRNLSTAEKRFGSPTQFFSVLCQDVCVPFTGFPNHVDYIIHAAGNADPVRFSTQPVETLMANVQGVDNLLRYGLRHGMKRFLYVSSGEVYGQPNENQEDFTEDYCGPIDLSDPRSCYPAGKRAAEVLCQSYIREHGADAVIVRPCHLFGPTMTARDNRAVSEFLRKAAAGENIQLKSAGTLERSHCYVVDAVGALLTALLKGNCGESYNIADRQYQMRICDFAEQAAAAGGCKTVYQCPSETERAGYSKSSRMVLNASRVKALGWEPMTQEAGAIVETVEILRGLIREETA